MLKLTSPFIRVLATTAFMSSLACAAPVFAQTPDDSMPTQSAPDNAADQDNTTSAQPVESHGKHGAAAVEQRIRTLHDKLKITSAQEDDFNAVAQTMRDNENEIAQMVHSRHANAASMTAIDDLQSYQKITQAHADGMQKMISSFQTLYDNMSDSQKKNADEVFGTFEGRRGHKNSKKHA